MKQFKASRIYKFNGLMVKMLRKQRGMGYRELAREVGMTPRAVRLIENGVTRDPRLSTMAAMANAIGVKVEQLIFEVKEDQ